MPLYDVQHVVPLTDAQKDELASLITEIHTTKFMVPRLFVNVYFTDISDRSTYVGGKRRSANHIIARVRLGNRKREEFQQITYSLEQAWESIVIQPQAEEAESDTQLKKLKLQTVMLVPTDSVGLEAGFELPTAGDDGRWLAKHYQEFQRRADAGDDDMKDVIAEIKERELL